MEDKGKSKTNEEEEEHKVAKFLLNHPNFVEKYLLNVEDTSQEESPLASITKKLQELCQNVKDQQQPEGCANGKHHHQLLQHKVCQVWIWGPFLYLTYNFICQSWQNSFEEFAKGTTFLQIKE